MRLAPALAALLVLVALGALAPVATAGPGLDRGATESTSVTEPLLDNWFDDEQEEDWSVEACAAEPPPDLSDPEENVIGWSNGFWYNESFELDQEEGLSEGEMNALIARTTARFEALRCLQANETPSVELQSREEFVEEQAALFDGINESERRFDNAKFEAMLMIGAEEDSVEVREANRGAAVLGYYDPVGERIVVISEDDETLRMDEITLAHEIGHAIQDQQFDLLEFDGQLRDVSNAEDGLIEGDVHLIEHRYEQRCAEGVWECSEVTQAGDEDGLDLASEGLYLLNFQPYSDGTTFAEALHDRGGWEAIDAAYDDPPTTSKHVIDPERYPEFEPANVTVDADPDPDWEQIAVPHGPDHDRIGKAGLSAMFMAPTLETGGQDGVVDVEVMYNFDEDGNVDGHDPLNYDLEATRGWTGDRFVAYAGPENETASAWTIEWDSTDDAETFLERYEELLLYRGAEAVEDRESAYRFGLRSAFDGGVAVVHDGTTTTVVNAPSVEALPAIHADAAPEIESDPEQEEQEDSDGAETGIEETPPSDDDADLPEETDDSTDLPDDGIDADEVPGFGPTAALVALFFGAVVFLRRR